MEKPNQKIEEKEFCAKENLKPWIWGLIIVCVVLILWLVVRGKRLPSKERVEYAWDDRFHTAKTIGWWRPGPAGCYVCPGCGWQGARLAVGAQGNSVCPRCGWCPYAAQRRARVGQPAAITGATPRGWWRPGSSGLYGCPRCGWQGASLKIDAQGNCACPQCGWCPYFGQTRAVVAGQPSPVVIRNLNMEVVPYKFGQGVKVTAVYPGGEAEAGGIMVGDRIRRFNNKLVGGPGQFKTLVDVKVPVETTVPVQVIRGRQRIKLMVTTGEGELPEGTAGTPAAFQRGQGIYPWCPQR